MGHLDGRRIVVTGAGRGIGAAVAEFVAKEGASVVVNDPGVALDGSGGDAGPAKELADRIVAAGGTAVPHLADVSDADQADDLIETGIREFGGVDVLINIAGIARDRMLFNMTQDEWDAVLAVHLTGTFNTTRAASRHWRAEKAGNYRLINTTSQAGLYGAPGQPNYAAAKMGIVGFTTSCANALMRYGVTSNVLCPGAATRMVDGFDSSLINKPGDKPRKRITAEQVAPAVAYMASTDSAWLNGQIIGAMGSTITLYSQPRVARELTTTDENWKLENVFEGFEKAFRTTVEGTENFYEVAALASARAQAESAAR